MEERETASLDTRSRFPVFMLIYMKCDTKVLFRLYLSSQNDSDVHKSVSAFESLFISERQCMDAHDLNHLLCRCGRKTNGKLKSMAPENDSDVYKSVSAFG